MTRALGSKYTLEGTIGRGAMGEVFSGVDADGRRLAFKVLHSDLAHDPAVVERFVRERSILLSLRSENLVEVHDLVIEGDTLAIVMELVEGSDLRGLMSEQGTLSPSEACRIGSGIARGLVTVHTQGIVHRDIKPENILIDASVTPVRPKVTDFGISSLMDTERARSTMLVGTPQYIAPEVSEGGAGTPASDFYALGVLLYELAVGVTPFAGGSVMAVLRRHSSMDPGRPAGIPDSLWDMITWLLAKNPAQRPAGAAQIATALDALSIELSNVPPAARLSAPPAPVPSLEAQPTQAVAFPESGPPAPAPTLQSPGLAAAYAGVDSPDTRDSAAPKARKKKPLKALALAAVAVLVLGAGGIFVVNNVLTGSDEPDPAAAQAPTESSTPSVDASLDPSMEPSIDPVLETSGTPSSTTSDPTESSSLVSESEVDADLVPNLIGKTEAEARELIREGVSIVSQRKYDNSQPKGTIVGQDPEAGASWGDEVALTVVQPTSTRYLSDLSTVGDGTGWESTSAVSLSGEPHDFGVSQSVCDGYEEGSFEYNVGRNYSEFSAIAGIDDNSINRDARIQVQVLNGDVQLASEVIAFDQPMTLKADLDGVLRMTIKWKSQTCSKGNSEDSSGSATLALGEATLLVKPGREGEVEAAE